MAARIAAFKLPPPVLPPSNESHVVTPARAVASPSPAPVEPAASAAVPGASATRGPGPHELCAEREPANVAACVKRLCDNDPRFQHDPAYVEETATRAGFLRRHREDCTLRFEARKPVDSMIYIYARRA